MFFVYLDEFGHVGPFISRQSERFNENPVFGLGGIILPHTAVRPFATRFLKLKEHVFKDDIAKARTIAQKWEKKGSDIFRPKALERYPAIRTCGFRLINTIRDAGGKIFYNGREKISNNLEVNSMGLYTTVLSHTIRRLNEYFTHINESFAIVVDEHSARPELLECAQKTMFSRENPAKHLLSPPFEVESYLDQNIQAADWIAAIIGRLWAYEISPGEYSDHAGCRAYYWDRVHQVAQQSLVMRRKPPRQPRPFKRESVVAALTQETSMTIALKRATVTR
jgi:hypothetical protein